MNRLPAAVTSVLPGAAIAVAVTGVFELSPLLRLENGPYDARMRWAADAERARSSRVRIVLRDPNDDGDASVWAELIRELTRRRPAAILIDDDEAAALLPTREGRRLRDAMQRIGRVVLSLPAAPSPTAATPLPENATVFIYGPSDAFEDGGFAAAPAAALTSSADRVGAARYDADPDRVVRRVPLAIRSGETFVPTVPLACAMTAFGESSLHVVDGGEGLDHFAGIDVPLDAGALRLRFHGPAGSFPTTSAAALARAFREGEESAWIGALGRGDVVLLGVRAPAETLATPTDPALPRVEVVATAVDNLIHADGLRPAGLLARLTWAAALGGLAARLVRRPRPRRAAILAAAAAGLYASLAWLAFAAGLVLDVTTPLLAAAAAAALVAWRNRRGVTRPDA